MNVLQNCVPSRLARRWLPLVTVGICLILTSSAQALTIPLLEEFDIFGGQVETVQIMDDGVNPPKSTFALYDTGASVVTLSAADQLLFDTLGTGIPIKNPGGATAQAIGGALIGDVSEPIGVGAVGLSAVNITPSGSFFDITIDTTNAVNVENVQVFVGTTSGSNVLPTITGMPIHKPSVQNPDGVAALIDMNGYSLDLGALFPSLPEFAGITLDMPDITFVPPNTTLGGSGGTGGGSSGSGSALTAPVRIPLQDFGVDNTENPGDMISAFPNPVQPDVQVEHAGTLTDEQTFLFDTGAQLSVISSEIADLLGLDPLAPERTIEVQGAAGTQASVPGYTIDALHMPLEGGDMLTFTDVPVFVLDIAAGIDGILGMNLFNTAEQMLFDPHATSGPGLELIFNEGPRSDELEDLLAATDEDSQATTDALIQFFGGSLGFVGGSASLPGFAQPTSGDAPASGSAVPEPSCLAMLLCAVPMFVQSRRRRRRRPYWLTSRISMLSPSEEGRHWRGVGEMPIGV